MKDFVTNLASQRRAIRVCAFGAGPGTELLAFAKFMSQLNLGFCTTVDFLLLDKVQEWVDSWHSLKEEVMQQMREVYGLNYADWPIIPNGNFVKCDVTNVSEISHLTSVWNQDLYILNFIISEIFDDSPKLREFLKTVSGFAPQGAKFLFIERKGSKWEKQIKDIAQKAGLELSPFERKSSSLDTDEEKEDFGLIYTSMKAKNKSPRTTYDVIYSVGTKL